MWEGIKHKERRRKTEIKEKGAGAHESFLQKPKGWGNPGRKGATSNGRQIPTFRSPQRIVKA
jgi:hypothetical protein